MARQDLMSFWTFFWFHAGQEKTVLMMSYKISEPHSQRSVSVCSGFYPLA